MKRIRSGLVSAAVVMSLGAFVPWRAAAAADAGASPDAKAREAVSKGLEWLKAQQKANGAWSDENFPALTAFGLWCFAASDHPDRAAICAKAAAFVAGCAQPDGGIYKPRVGQSGGLSTYNTAICMSALHAADRAKYAEIVLKARAFVAGSQLKGDSPNAGGFGYDQPAAGREARADLSNSGWAMHAMRLTQGVEDLRPAGAARADIDWAAARRFLEKLQNQDKQDADNFGGFGYAQGGARGGTTEDKTGAVKLRAFGSMTYAGLESMVYAEMTRSDPRVISTLQWAGRHWSVDENPGMGTKGLYYYYNIAAKALTAAGAEEIARDGGGSIPWKRQLLNKLVALQGADGSWVNSDNTVWEGNAALVTAYAVQAMQYALAATPAAGR